MGRKETTDLRVDTSNGTPPRTFPPHWTISDRRTKTSDRVLPFVTPRDPPHSTLSFRTSTTFTLTETPLTRSSCVFSKTGMKGREPDVFAGDPAPVRVSFLLSLSLSVSSSFFSSFQLSGLSRYHV